MNNLLEDLPDRMNRSDFSLLWESLQELYSDFRGIMNSNKDQINRHVLDTHLVIQEIVRLNNEQEVEINQA